MSAEYTIEKIPLEEFDRVLPRKAFPRMPILYLEFLENKTKVKKELLNKNYVPPSDASVRIKDQRKESRDDRGSRDDRDHHSREDHHGSRDDRDSRDDDHGSRNERSNHQDEPRDQNDEERNEEHRSSEPGSVEDKLNSLLGEDEPQEKESEDKRPPTLQELQQKKKITISRDYRYAEEEDEETQKERNAVYFKYEVLRRMHPNATIPEFTMFSDPKVMSQKYEMLTKRLSLESSVDNWKRYMIVFVMGCEVVLGKMSFDMEGFAQQQITSMSTYDQLLVEMAEKSYVPSGSSKWSPEVRLFMMLTMNVVLFVISKMIFKKTGTNLLGTINEMSVNQERKMKEPEA